MSISISGFIIAVSGIILLWRCPKDSKAFQIGLALFAVGLLVFMQDGSIPVLTVSKK